MLVIEAGGDPSPHSKTTSDPSHPESSSDSNEGQGGPGEHDGGDGNDYKTDPWAPVRTSATMPQARSSPICSWQLKASEGLFLNKRTADAAVGKGLGGSSNINAGVWCRGSKQDWDEWADMVGDERWGWKKMLPYFRLIECDGESNEGQTKGAEGGETGGSNGEEGEQVRQQGKDGSAMKEYLDVHPVKETKDFPLRGTVRIMWERAGFKYVGDMDSGEQEGFHEAVDLWESGGRRQLLVDKLDFAGADIWTDTSVKRIVIEEGVARGVDLSNGSIIKGNEVILCAGAYQSPRLLMASGIQNAQIGANLADHLMLTLTYRLKDDLAGMAFSPSRLATEPFWLRGFPMDFIHYDRDGALQNWNVYLPFPKPVSGVEVPVDGGHISVFVCLAKPTSRGRVTMETIEKNFMSTACDRKMMRERVRKMAG